MKFKFMDRVEVLSGFYQGATGLVVDYFTLPNPYETHYIVLLDASPDKKSFPPDNLKTVAQEKE